jgi:ABC-type glycerol-3-phosphate transport system permease component
MSAARRVAYYLVLSIGALIVLAPLLWMVSSSLKNDAQIDAYPPVWLPQPIVWQNYVDAWTKLPTGRFYLNSFVIAGFSIVGNVLSCSLAAYAFARLRFPGRTLFFSCALATMMLPGQVTLIPTYILFSRLGWLNTLLPLIAPRFFATSAFSIFLLRQFFLTVPRDVDEAALLDGAGFLTIYRRIVLPLARPAIGVVVVLTFAGTWNAFTEPLIYLNDLESFTVALGLRAFMSVRFIDQQSIMAMSFLATLPMLFTFFVAQHAFLRGITLGPTAAPTTPGLR